MSNATERRPTAHASPVTVTERPSIAASVLAVVAATLTVLAIGVPLVPVLLVDLAGVGVVAGGMALTHRDWRLPGYLVALVGAATCVVAVGLAASSAADTSQLLWHIPGVLGIGLLGLAIAPLRGSGTRWLVKAGAGGVFVTVAIAGLFRAAPLGTLLLATAGAIVAWDAGEHAIDVGRQLGRSTSTWRLDVAHVGATAVVGAIAVLVGHAVAGIQAGTLSLSAYALFFVALLALTVALHR